MNRSESLSHWLIYDSAANADSVTQKLNSFAQLPDGWHFGEGRRSKLLALNYAKTINRIAITNGWQTDAFPGISGEIMLSIENSAHYYEVVIEIDGTLNFVEEKNGEELQRRNISIADMVETLSPNSSSCPTFVLYTPHIGTKQKDDSHVWLFGTLAQSLGAEFQSSNETVLKNEAGPFARTLEHTMSSSSPDRFSFGKLTPELSRRIA